MRYRTLRTKCLLAISSLLTLKTAVSIAAAPVDFNREIRPILAENCFQCHGPDAANRKADLRLDTESGAKANVAGVAAVVPNNPDKSELIRRINHSDPDDRMPPEDSKRKLSEGQKEQLTQWILEGAQWENHWAFVSPARQVLPTVQSKNWPLNEIDYFVLARLEKEGLSPSYSASKETLIRRLTLDLTGLPPTHAEVDAFLSDHRPDAYEQWVNRLLKSPRYGEHMAWQWLDAARYADTDGYQNDGPREMWRWRDWVIDAYNKNLPFDQFTIEQLAGDLLPNRTQDQVIATGFNRNHRYNSESGLVFEEFLLENAVDRVDTTSTVWMGLTLGCARCHDHKYDPISQKEYYQLIAYFNSVPESGRAIKFGNSEPWIKAPTKQQLGKLKELQQDLNVAELKLEKASSMIASHQKEWEASLESNELQKPILPTALTHHFAAIEEIQTDGISEHKLENIPNLVCNERFSIAFQITPRNVNQGAVLSNEAKGTGRNGILVEFQDGHLRFHIISRWIAGVATLETTHTFKSEVPIHVTLTNDGTQRSQGMRIYLNGKRAETRTLHNSNSNKSAKNTGGLMQVGFSQHIPGWEGAISDLRFYQLRTLTQEEADLLAEPTHLSDLTKVPLAGRTKLQATKLTSYFLSHVASNTLSRLVEQVRKAQSDYLNFHDTLPTTMVMEETPQPKPTHLRLRGVYHQKGNLVSRGVPSILPEMPSEFPENRLGFARWLVSGNHPLTARVTVNRFWQQFFDRGLVKTPGDFGAQGSLPSHPKLLDWLAVEFVEQGWDTHQLLKKIVTSATYRQSSTITSEALSNDPENVLLSRAPRRRLPGNILRDQALLLGGLLVEKEGGPSVKPFQPENLWREASNFTYKMGTGSDLYRRSLYTYWKRTLAPPSMALLDTADREWCSVRSKKTNTPLQALTLLNEEAFFDAARSFGQSIYESSGSLQDKLGRAFVAVTARQPSPAESDVLKRSFESYREDYSKNPKAIKALFKTKKAIDTLKSPTELAAFTAIANVLLNLDETTTRE
ncbi:DUF1549 domain-containing protein [Verrucomicrobia bacterium]|jgi:hypothetical protein|nr:DUF1549 domain-containing protein [Verrucomicrobiota bacterium]